MNCRHCAKPLVHSFVDLGWAPPSNAYRTLSDLSRPEVHFPLRVLVCDGCWLVQTEDFAAHDELFAADYAYFSSFSRQWLDHARTYASAMRTRFSLGGDSRVVEVAANDGYLLQYFREDGIPCLGVEPTRSTADAARAKGIDIVEEFFGVALAERLAADGGQADLIAANNVLAHVPDINDFVSGFASLLKPSGVATFEFPHLLQLLEHGQFDTIYHEHFSYLSLTAVRTIFARSGLAVFDVEEIPTHGGSLRVFAQQSDSGRHAQHESVSALISRETEAGIQTVACYEGFQARVDRIKDEFVAFLIDAKKAGLKVAAYGAAAKGNTLINFAGVRPDHIPYVVDRNPAKQGKMMPGSHIPIVGEERIFEDKPDLIFILPWNLKEEVIQQLSKVREWNARFAVAVPGLTLL